MKGYSKVNPTQEHWDNLEAVIKPVEDFFDNFNREDYVKYHNWFFFKTKYYDLPEPPKELEDFIVVEHEFDVCYSSILYDNLLDLRSLMKNTQEVLLDQDMMRLFNKYCVSNEI